MPKGLDRIIATCLAKAPDDRWPRARDVLRELTWVRDDDRPRAAPAPTIRAKPWPWLAAAGVVALVVAALVAGVLVRRDAPPARISFNITAPRGQTFPRATAEMAISPDGTRLAFVAFAGNGRKQLWLRQFDDSEAHAIAGTVGASMPFWSPDGRRWGSSLTAI